MIAEVQSSKEKREVFSIHMKLSVDYLKRPAVT
jgi:hypothetical protein